MGWKISLVIIENNNKFSNDELLLKKAGFRTIKKVDTVDFETALGTKNKICIGNINDNIVICDDYKLTEYFLSENNNLDLTEGEKNISSLFLNSEILAVACHSVSDFHAYSLIQNGKKTRLKIVSQEEKIEFGEKFEEENLLYKDAIQIEDELFWDLDHTGNEDDYYSESNLMEEFTFGITKRRLGVELNLEEADEILKTYNFRVYDVDDYVEEIKRNNAKDKTWVRIIIYIIIFITIQLINQFMKSK